MRLAVARHLFPPPLREGMKRLTILCRQEKKKKIKKTCENSVKSLDCFVRRRYYIVIKNLFFLGRALLF